MKRVEDPRLVKGIGTYTDDVRLPGMLHACILRSPHAHARIVRIDAGAAKAIPGVVAVFTGADVNDSCGLVPCAASIPDLKAPAHTVLADDRVYFAGHAVAVAVAADPYIARDAIDAIDVDYDPLPVVTDPEEAVRGGTLTHPELGTNVAFTQSVLGGSDIDDAFRRADRVVKHRLYHQRLTPMPIEPRAVVASYHAGEGTLTLWSATQVPHLLRTLLPPMIGVAENKLRIIAPEVGGGFGAKLNVYAEEALCGHLAMRLNAPVKWIESRRE
ncbi:MAG: carbon monoxide dehydrogenase, partial [Acidobacteria bacterium]